jgi:hypothetical protein
VSANGSVVSGCTDHSFDPGISDQDFLADGISDPVALAMFQGNPTERFSTLDVARALTVLGLGGYAATAAVDFYLRLCSDLGLRTAGAVNLKISQYRGLIVPTDISASQGGAAKINFNAIGEYNGTNAPYSIAVNQAVPTTIAPCLFTLGPVILNGTAIGGVSSMRMALNYQVGSVAADGEVWPSKVWIQSRRPIITIRTTQASLINTFGTVGAAITASYVTIYLRQMSPDGIIYANNTSNHIKFVIPAGKINVGPVSANGNDAADCEVTIRPRYNLAADMITASTNQQIA